MENNELILRYGCNPHQAPARIFSRTGSLPIKVLNGREEELADFGKLMHESWMLKRSLTQSITSEPIDEIYQAAMEAGASGGKLLGAGGGGFMLFFAKPEIQPKVRERLGNLLYVPFNFSDLGSQIVYYAPENNV